MVLSVKGRTMPMIHWYYTPMIHWVLSVKGYDANDSLVLSVKGRKMIH